MSAQIAVGHSFMILRELHQLVITLTEQYESLVADEWRRDAKRTIIQLIHETVTTLRDGRHAAALARNVGCHHGIGIDGSKALRSNETTSGSDDPMVLVHALRSHLYHDSNAICKSRENGSIEELQLLERCKMIDLLHEFTISYRNLLRIASSPLPFVLVQMGRTFIFVWTLSLPFVLTGKDFVQEFPSVFCFVILLTYGFLGLEFVSRILSNPFGDEVKNDLNIRGMGTASIIGIEEDAKLFKEEFPQKMSQNSGTKCVVGRSSSDASVGSLRNLVQKRQIAIRMSPRYIVLDGSTDAMDDNTMNKYSAMEEDSEQQTSFPFS